MKIANYVMLAAFIFGVIVQYNDPDPLRWMAIYGAAAVACGLYAAGRRLWIVPAVVLVIAVIWAATLAPAALGKVGFGELFEAFEMKDERVEIGREFGGLMIIAAWMLVLTIVSRRKAVHTS
ncbi:MAG TPA: transmembrane 220 family protein [Blastocatellia bacterium]|nr:transmembrane 220 family protein [Blastocatellia bacterium]